MHSGKLEHLALLAVPEFGRRRLEQHCIWAARVWNHIILKDYLFSSIFKTLVLAVKSSLLHPIKLKNFIFEFSYTLISGFLVRLIQMPGVRSNQPNK